MHFFTRVHSCTSQTILYESANVCFRDYLIYIRLRWADAVCAHDIMQTFAHILKSAFKGYNITHHSCPPPYPEMIGARWNIVNKARYCCGSDWRNMNSRERNMEKSIIKKKDNFLFFFPFKDLGYHRPLQQYCGMFNMSWKMSQGSEFNLLSALFH